MTTDEPAPGLLDGRYRLHEVLGAGMFGTVYRAEHRVIGRTLRRVAVKVLDPRSVKHTADALREAVELFDLVEGCADPRIRDRFVRCLDAGVERDGAGRTYIVMELAAGNLAELTGADTRLAPDRVLGILRDLAEALDYLHRNNTAHLDLKPDNVLTSAHRAIRIGDFGHARRLSAVLRGTPPGGALIYQPPEAVAFGHSDVSADVYATGLIAHELLTGTLPFGPELAAAAGSVPDRGALVEVKRRPVPAPSAVEPELAGHPLDTLVPRMLAPDPPSRIPDGTALLAALAATDPPGDGTSVPPVAPPMDTDPLAVLRHARLGDDRAAVVERAGDALAALREPGSAATAEGYAEVVNAYLAVGDVATAREAAIEATRRLPGRVADRAARRAFAGTALADGFGEP